MTTIAEKRKALGRGLESLLPGGPRAVPVAPASPGKPESSNANGGMSGVPGKSNGGAPEPLGTTISMKDAAIAALGTSAMVSEPKAQASRAPVDGEALTLELDRIDPNPYQTRTHLREDELAELTESIKVSGVLQPVVVRPGKEGRFTLIVGERRCQASRRAGKTSIPAVLRMASDEQAAEMTIIENLQRSDLNPLEQGRAFVRLSTEFGLTQEQIGLRTGISRESVSNYMRLTRLPEDVQAMLAQKSIDFSMARVLLRLDTPEQMSKAAHKAVEKGMTVLQLESLVFAIKMPLQKVAEEKPSRILDPNVRAAQQQLERSLGMRVRIRDRRGKGKIVIEYATLEDFDRVLEMLNSK